MLSLAAESGRRPEFYRHACSCAKLRGWNMIFAFGAPSVRLDLSSSFQIQAKNLSYILVTVQYQLGNPGGACSSQATRKTSSYPFSETMRGRRCFEDSVKQRFPIHHVFCLDSVYISVINTLYHPTFPDASDSPSRMLGLKEGSCRFCRLSCYILFLVRESTRQLVFLSLYIHLFPANPKFRMLVFGSSRVTTKLFSGRTSFLGVLLCNEEWFVAS